jgi:dynein heavy chain
MRNVLEDLEQACVIIQEFYAILGPDLKAVTGNAEQIDAENEKVKDQVRKLEAFPRDVFSDKQENLKWKTLFQDFNNSIKSIDQQVVNLIEKTFGE